MSKFADALPLYRIAALLHRFGGDLSRGMLAASVVRVGTAVQPLINLMRDHLLEADIIYGDETTVQVLKEPGRAAQRKSYMWAQMNGTGPPVRMFSYSPTRSAAQAAVLYAGIKPSAVLMSDVYERPPFAQVSVFSIRQNGCRCISGLVTADHAAAAPYEIRLLTPHWLRELNAQSLIQVS